ncbi:sigma-70 family RNA polymerase sigma factor [soil metagenome]
MRDRASDDPELHANPVELRGLLLRAAADDLAAVGQLFDMHRDRLRRMIRVRIDHRLQGRLDPSDVLQEAFLEFARALPNYTIRPEVPFYLWLRCIAGRKLATLHRRHLGTDKRDAGREISIHRGGLPEASSLSLTDQLVGKFTTPSLALRRAEERARIQHALSEMDELDREVLALRHFEQLSNKESALVLDMTEAATSVRYMRALRRLKAQMMSLPGGASETPDGA